MHHLLLMFSFGFGAGPVWAQTSPVVTHSFEGLSVPVTPEQKMSVQVSPSAVWFGQQVSLTYTPLFRTGTPVGDSAGFAWLHDVNGRPIKTDNGHPVLCNGLDGATLMQSDGALYSVVHAECHPGALQLSRLSQDATTGQLRALSTQQVDLKSIGGGNLFCAAELTAWNTHLAAEEFEADASKLQPDGTVSDNFSYYNTMARYWGDLSGQSPYQLGWIDELEVHKGTPKLHKRYALGRFSHEQARVMPDQRTVYLTDDGTNGGFFVFIADVPGDLTAGHLYMSRWRQNPGEQFDLDWVSLGHATEAEIAAAMVKPPAFDALFEVDDAAECKPGFQRIRTTHEHRCVRVRPGAEVLASRLESRRYGAMRGGTAELRKWEGMAVDAPGRRLFVAASSVTHGMLEKHPEWDIAAADHVRMRSNPCGVVMGMDVANGPVKDLDGVVMKSDWVVARTSVFLAGRPLPASDPDAPLQCDVDAIANPDNLAMIPESGMLMIAEDTHAHENNVLWSMDLKDKTLTRLLTVPKRAEVSGINWFPNFQGFGYLTVSIQFPHADWREPEKLNASMMSTSGVIGPFPTQGEN